MGRRVIGTVVVALALTVAACSPDREPTVGPTAPTVVPSAQAPELTPVPTAPIATTSASPAALGALEPVAGADLPLAGRDGAPGLVSCGRVGPTTYEALTAGPVGAERLAGPEHDVLRRTAYVEASNNPHDRVRSRLRFAIVYIGCLDKTEGRCRQ